MRRRAFLRGLAGAPALLLHGCGPFQRPSGPPRRRLPKLPRVDVRPEREIRTVVGLRPFRPSGFVVRAQPLGDKLLVHNYGHGGGGVTLSWGTSELAARLLDSSAGGPVAVLGAGAVGLSAARLLQERGRDVTVYAKALPPHTTSNIAGAQWFPASVFDDDRVTPGFRQQMVDAARIAHGRFQLLVGERYGIRWLPNFFFSSHGFSEDGLLGMQSPLRAVMPDLFAVPDAENPFPAPFVRVFDTMLIEPNVYLPALLDDVRRAGARIVVRELRSLQEVAALPERAVVNCTGLGAKELFGDAELVPIKGQLTFLLPQPEIDYATISRDLYMLPRRDGIALGGTHERGVWTLEPNAEAHERILREHAAFFAAMKS